MEINICMATLTSVGCALHMCSTDKPHMVIQWSLTKTLCRSNNVKWQNIVCGVSLFIQKGFTTRSENSNNYMINWQFNFEKLKMLFSHGCCSEDSEVLQIGHMRRKSERDKQLHCEEEFEVFKWPCQCSEQHHTGMWQDFETRISCLPSSIIPI